MSKEKAQRKSLFRTFVSLSRVDGAFQQLHLCLIDQTTVYSSQLTALQMDQASLKAPSRSVAPSRQSAVSARKPQRDTDGILTDLCVPALSIPWAFTKTEPSHHCSERDHLQSVVLVGHSLHYFPVCPGKPLPCTPAPFSRCEAHGSVNLAM